MFDKLLEKYEIISLVEQGGFGSVYRARDIKTGKMYAIKENIITSEEYRIQFQNEAMALYDVNHPNLPKVVDFLSAEESSYLVMEFIEGEDVKKIISYKGPINLNLAVDWILQIGKALHYLHTKIPPLIHRDVKPSNIVISNKNHAFLIDFGLVKRNDLDKTLAAAKAISTGYSPPEQYNQSGTSVKSDIYALGATLFSMITGEIPQDSVSRLLEDEFNKQINKYSNVPVSLKKIISRSMALKLSERYESVSDFILDLKATRVDDAVIDIQVHEQFVGSVEKKPMVYLQKIMSAQNINFAPSVNVVEKKQFNKKINIITWDDINLAGYKYWLTKKYYKKSKQPGDGEYWICDDNYFEDFDVQNGLVVFYTIFAYDGEHFSHTMGTSQAFIRTDDVEKLIAERVNKTKVILKWSPPQNVGRYTVIRNVYAPSSSPHKGTKIRISDELYLEKPDSQGFIEITDTDVPENIPVWYTLYCIYKKSRGTWVTSKGINTQV